MSEADPAAADAVAARVRLEVERAIQRNIKGLEFLSAPRQPVGACEKDVLHRRGTLNLYHYRPLVDEVYRVPVLLVMAPSNKGYIFDLARGQSLVEFLLMRGYDVFMIDWAAPRSDEKTLALKDYVLDFLPDCIDRVLAATGEPDVSLAGYCMGGTLSVLYATLFPEGPLKNLVCFATPIDFAQMTLFRAWSDKAHFDVDRLVDRVGNIPGDLILGAFDLMRPANRTAGVLHLWNNMWNDEFVKSYRMFDRWAAETLPLPGEFFRDITKQFMWANALYEDALEIGGRPARLAAITAPVCNIIAQHDHVVPFEAAHPLTQKISSSEVFETVVKGGHVSVVAGVAALKRLWPTIDTWLAGRST
ncbi:alpha/beta fold hydrolase [Sphingomonas profundi]|uniref:alpha/beta fold hydrolase n=1 Tax=Alterirhizorhabdus profundi TaxID=2681549 RepID=UPI0012E877FC|nr:alpha/beta fold hydrolase [Sphingomonas profundi]